MDSPQKNQEITKGRNKLTIETLRGLRISPGSSDWNCNSNGTNKYPSKTSLTLLLWKLYGKQDLVLPKVLVKLS